MTTQNSCSTQAEAIQGRLSARPPALILVPALTTVCALLLGFAWIVRDHRYLSADRDLGYLLGIAGLSAMVLLLLYPLRKRSARMQHWGPVRLWFHAHMALGIVGPTLVLLHSNFDLGSPNSSVSLFSALLVAGSGYVGRFAYARIHFGLSGSRAHYAQVLGDVRELRSALGNRDSTLDAAFASLEAWAGQADLGMGHALLRYVGARRRIARLRREVRGIQGRHLSRAASQRLEAYLLATRRLARFRTYERIFSLWHSVHLPLSFLLFGAAAVHVVAVHLY